MLIIHSFFWKSKLLTKNRLPAVVLFRLMLFNKMAPTFTIHFNLIQRKLPIFGKIQLKNKETVRQRNNCQARSSARKELLKDEANQNHSERFQCPPL